MPDHPRTPDYLVRHVNLENRIRALETGVHPTGSDFNYYDTVLATDIDNTDNPYWAGLVQGIHGIPPQWQKRVGMVSLLGGYMTKTGVDALALPDDPVEVGQLPDGARPLIDIPGYVTYSSPPYTGLVTIQTDGKILAHKPVGFAESFLFFRLESIAYSVN